LEKKNLHIVKHEWSTSQKHQLKRFHDFCRGTKNKKKYDKIIMGVALKKVLIFKDPFFGDI